MKRKLKLLLLVFSVILINADIGVQIPACCNKKADGVACSQSDECIGSCNCKVGNPFGKKCIINGVCQNQSKSCSGCPVLPSQDVPKSNSSLFTDFKDKGSQLLDKASELKKKAIDILFMDKVRSEFNKSNPYKDKQAEIRQSSELSHDEINVINKRLQVNNKNLEKIIGKEIDNNKSLKMAIVASGGGYRALISTLGYLNGMQKTGLLDSVTYAAGLSGGAWAIASWLSSEKSIQEFINMTRNNIAINKKLGDLSIPHVENSEIKNIISNLLNLYVFDVPLSSIDLWGAIINDNLLNPIKNRHKLNLSSQKKIIEAGNKPFPIYTAVQPIKSSYYNWFEFTPYEVGDITNNIYVPTWAFGRRFANGKSVYNSPELTLDFYLGVFGSAFTVSIEELENKLGLRQKLIEFLHNKFPKNSIETLDKKLNFKKFFDDIEDKDILIRSLFRKRTLYGEVANPAYKIKGNTQKDIVLVDAGVEFNLPLPPVLRSERQVNIIIILDASEEIKTGSELFLAEKYARTANINFPKIDYLDIDHSINIFGTESTDPDMPIVIYMPIINDFLKMTDQEIQTVKSKLDIKDSQLLEKVKKFDPKNCIKSGFCSTFNFAYSNTEFDLLSGLTYLNVIVNKDKIYDAIKKAYNKKYNLN